MKKRIIIMIVAFIVFIFAFVYFVSSVSATFPAIREYKYNGTAQQLMTNFQTFSQSNPHVGLNIEDTLGIKDPTYVFTIRTKFYSRKLLFELQCGKSDTESSAVLELIGAHDLTNLTGGYGIKADRMDQLLNNFNSAILIPMQNQQNIKLTQEPDN